MWKAAKKDLIFNAVIVIFLKSYTDEWIKLSQQLLILA
jgi:hypothetical protein